MGCGQLIVNELAALHRVHQATHNDAVLDGSVASRLFKLLQLPFVGGSGHCC